MILYGILFFLWPWLLVILVKVIPLIPSLEENLIQPEHDPNQPDNQQSNQYGDNQIRHASSAFLRSD